MSAIVLNVGNPGGAYTTQTLGWCLRSDLYFLRSNLEKIKAGPQMFRGAIGSQEGITINIEVVMWRDLRMGTLEAE